MSESHPAVKEARKGLEQELEALTRRISVRRESNHRDKMVEAEQDRAKSAALTSPSERAEANVRAKRSSTEKELPENSWQKEPAGGTRRSERQAARRYGLERVVGTAGRVVRWLRSLCGR